MVVKLKLVRIVLICGILLPLAVAIASIQFLLFNYGNRQYRSNIKSWWSERQAFNANTLTHYMGINPLRVCVCVCIPTDSISVYIMLLYVFMVRESWRSKKPLLCFALLGLAFNEFLPEPVLENLINIFLLSLYFSQPTNRFVGIRVSVCMNEEIGYSLMGIKRKGSTSKK